MDLSYLFKNNLYHLLSSTGSRGNGAKVGDIWSFDVVVEKPRCCCKELQESGNPGHSERVKGFPVL